MIETGIQGDRAMQAHRWSWKSDRERVVQALADTGCWLTEQGYRFTTITPRTHSSVLARGGVASGLADIFGWNRTFDQDLLPPDIFQSLREAELLSPSELGWSSMIRYSTLGNSLYAHSGHPTHASDAVFFGPDSQRFVAALHRHVPACGLLLDVGCGSGVGGLQVRQLASRLILSDISERALMFAEANARIAGADHVDVRQSDLLAQIHERPDVIISNPPYLVDSQQRTYRNGGGERGTEIAQRIVAQALIRLRPGGQLILYTGTPVVNGVDQFFDRIEPLLAEAATDVSYEEIDPDVFGEELERSAYSDVDRIAVVLLRLTRPNIVKVRHQSKPGGTPVELRSHHAYLARYFQGRLTPAVFEAASPETRGEPRGDARAALAAADFLASERSAVSIAAMQAPTDADEFVAWFSRLEETGPGQHDGLFPWLAEHADLDQMKWFLHQELAGEAGFDDLLALTQIKMPARVKMEMARNLWDEFGRGNPSCVHGTLLGSVESELSIPRDPDALAWEPLALGNLMAGLALDRGYAYHAVGALGAIEMTAPGRVALVNAGMLRVGIPSAARRYFELHASLDVEHSEAWNREVLHPLVASDPRLAVPLAEGALMRLEAGRRCFEAYRAHFGIPPRVRASIDSHASSVR